MREASIMANIHRSTLDLIGGTPLLEVVNIEKNWGLRLRFL